MTLLMQSTLHNLHIPMNTAMISVFIYYNLTHKPDTNKRR